MIKIDDTDSQAWQRAVRAGDKVVLAGPGEEVIWAEIINPLEHYINPFLARSVAEELDSNSNLRLACVHYGQTPNKPEVMIIHVGFIEMAVPLNIFESARKAGWPLDAFDLHNLMRPMVRMIPQKAYLC